ncbi:hypothetical protein B0T20DRAFT_120759 [Sordaria brevicollis]|uniref:Uncharacterized protein n=1 Tax=Sordaria brevicollis TaxID=83679 RepID=A0AAE0PKS4_SORBR|nr:hypothetical protein B0T20DRAFT_120759 [Sordaria brevicollis]
MPSFADVDEEIPNTFLPNREMLSPSIRSILEPVSRVLGCTTYESFTRWLISKEFAPLWTEFERDCLQPLVALKASDPTSFPEQDVPDTAVLKPASACSVDYLAAIRKVPIPAHYLIWTFNRYINKPRKTSEESRKYTHTLPVAALKERYKPEWKPYQHVLLFFGQVWIRNQSGINMDPTMWAMQLCYLLDGMTRAKYGEQLGVHVKEFDGGKKDEGCIISFKHWPDCAAYK